MIGSILRFTGDRITSFGFWTRAMIFGSSLMGVSYFAAAGSPSANAPVRDLSNAGGPGTIGDLAHLRAAPPPHEVRWATKYRDSLVEGMPDILVEGPEGAAETLGELKAPGAAADALAPIEQVAGEAAAPGDVAP